MAGRTNRIRVLGMAAVLGAAIAAVGGTAVCHASREEAGLTDEELAGEHAIGGAAGAEAVLAAGDHPFPITVPADAKPGGWARLRRHSREDVGQVARVDDALAVSRGAARLGEVEDYRLPFPDHYLCHTIRDRSSQLVPPPPPLPQEVQIQDQLAAQAGAFEPVKPRLFCRPAS